MRQNSNYTLIELNDTYHILPVGQGIADLCNGIQINESCALLWNLLANDMSQAELTDAYISATGAPDSSELRSDVKFIIDMFLSRGVMDQTVSSTVLPISNADEHQPTTALLVPAGDTNIPHYKNIRIAALGIRLYGVSDFFIDNFDIFEVDDLPAQTMDVTVSTASVSDNIVTNCNKPMIRSVDFNIFDTASAYIIRYPSVSAVDTVVFSKDGLLVNIYIKSNLDIDRIREDLFHAIRLPFLYLAEKHGYYAVHSASILYRDKAWLFSASSGTGKSTLARMWTQAKIADDINGDLNLIGISDNVTTVFGIPWCGTSGIYTSVNYPLGGVVFLKRASENTTDPQTLTNGLLLLSKRIISPIFKPADLHKLFSDLSSLPGSIHFYIHRCTNSVESKDVLKSAIDLSLLQSSESPLHDSSHK
ncbi:MAG: PqqD family protein [Lachnospiraceae bacterium]|nr:PqqD family protein [Lachnospiraceae bacterium]